MPIASATGVRYMLRTLFPNAPVAPRCWVARLRAPTEGTGAKRNNRLASANDSMWVIRRRVREVMQVSRKREASSYKVEMRITQFSCGALQAIAYVLSRMTSVLYARQNDHEWPWRLDV